MYVLHNNYIMTVSWVVTCTYKNHNIPTLGTVDFDSGLHNSKSVMHDYLKCVCISLK